jgi:hypothetical protein
MRGSLLVVYLILITVIAKADNDYLSEIIPIQWPYPYHICILYKLFVVQLEFTIVSFLPHNSVSHGMMHHNENVQNSKSIFVSIAEHL